MPSASTSHDPRLHSSFSRLRARTHASGWPSASAGIRRLGAVAIAACAVGFSAACASHDATPYGLVVRVNSDLGHPVPGASVSFLGRPLGTTDDAGALGLAVAGIEGEHVELRVSCPDGFQSPKSPVDVVLHHVAEAGRTTEYDLVCASLSRTLVIVVRADQGPNLPLLYLGREVARTDESGAAHALINVPFSDDPELTLSTAGAGNGRLRPQNPTMKFISTDGDEVKLFNVTFASEPEKPHPRAAGPRLPIRLN